MVLIMIQMTKGQGNTTTPAQDEEEATTLRETTSSEDPIDDDPCPQKIRKPITGLIVGILIGIITIVIVLAVMIHASAKNIPFHSDDSRVEPIKSTEYIMLDEENDKGRSQDKDKGRSQDKEPDKKLVIGGLNEKDLKSGSGQVNQSPKETTGEKSDQKV